MCKLIAFFVRGLLCFVFHVFACVLSLRLFYKVDRQKDKSWESSVTMLKSFISHFSAVNSYVRHFVEHFFHFEYWLNVCSYMIHVCRGPLCVCWTKYIVQTRRQRLESSVTILKKFYIPLFCLPFNICTCETSLQRMVWENSKCATLDLQTCEHVSTKFER